jgi:hypothetical protein
MGTQLAGSAAADLSLDIFRLGASLRRARDLTVDQAWALATMYAANGTLPGVTLPAKPARKAIINTSIVKGVTFVHVGTFEMKAGRFTGRIGKESIQPIGVAGPLDLRLVVFVHRLAGRLRSRFGVSRIYHLGFVTEHKDSHGDGRAFDFVGIGGQLDGHAFHINVLSHWNLQPVEMPVAFGKLKAGDRADAWPAGFTQTVYRLDPAKNKHLDPGILRTNLGSTAPEFELKTAFERSRTSMISPPGKLTTAGTTRVRRRRSARTATRSCIRTMPIRSSAPITSSTCTSRSERGTIRAWRCTDSRPYIARSRRTRRGLQGRAKSKCRRAG